MSYGIAFHLTFFIDHLKLQKSCLEIPPHALSHEHDAYGMV